MRFSDGLAGETLYAMDDSCPSAPDNSCNSGFTTIENEEIPVAYIHPDHNDHKFAISHEIAHAVETLFDVSVVEVRTMRMPRKTRRVGKFMGRKPEWKKALVRLQEGQSIEFYEGV